jgi:hypothetical protein
MSEALNDNDTHLNERASLPDVLPLANSEIRLSLENAANYLGILKASFRNWVQSGLLPPPQDQTWERKAIDSALALLCSCGVPGDQKSRNARRYPHVQHIRRRLVDDTYRHHYRFRPTGARLPSLLGAAEFMQALIACERRLYRDAPQAVAMLQEDAPLLQPATPAYDEPKCDQSEPIRLASHCAATNTLFLTPQELSARWRGEILVQTLANWRFKRIGPGYVRAGKAILYPISEIEKWECANLITCGR